MANISAGVSSKFISGVLASVIMLPTSVQALDNSNIVKNPDNINTSDFNMKSDKNSYENNISTIVKI